MLSAMVAVGPIWAEVTLPNILSDNMLVQQGKPIPWAVLLSRHGSGSL